MRGVDKRVEGYIIAADIAFRQSKELIAFLQDWSTNAIRLESRGGRRETNGTSLHHLLQCQVHPCIAVNQMSVERLSIFKLNKHGVALCRGEE